MVFLRLIVGAVAIVVVAVGIHVDAAPVEASHSQQHKVMRFAKNQVGKPYKWGATGLRRYDCSGLVYRTFKNAGALKRIGGRRATAHWYFRWFRDRGLVTRNPRKGDLVAWGKSRVSHIGIFAGYNKKGRPLSISATYPRLSRHRVHAMNVPFRAYLRVRISR